MKADKNDSKSEATNFLKVWVEKWEKKGFVKCVIDGFTYFFPPLVNRPRCFTCNSPEGCLYCGNNTFRYYSKAGGKKYYQCEKCWGINH
jgi:hypothetical protein